MIHYAAWAFGIIFALGTLTWLCLGRSGFPVIATVVFAVLTGAAFAAVIESAGQAKPLQLEWRNVLDAPLVGLTWNEEQRIVWVWTMVDGAPVAYSLPWPDDQKKMGELQDKWRRKGATGDEFMLQMDGEVAKVVPPKPMPDKAQ